jgi:DNA-binding IclR family transcriptional regulator
MCGISRHQWGRKMVDVTGRTPSIKLKTNEPQGAGGVQSVARALSILELFDDRNPTLTTKEIATLSGLNRGTAYRFCRTLLALGYLEEAAPSTFRPGLKVISLAQAVLGSREIISLAMPFLQNLRGSTNETVNMGMLDDTDIVYMARLLNSDLVILRVAVGSRLPAYASSLGRAILAFLPKSEADDILARSDIKEWTSETITGRSDLAQELTKTRKRGYAFNNQGIALGVSGIAAPVLGKNDRPIGAVNLSIARPLTLEQVADELAPAVMKTAQEISARAQEIGLS